MLKVTEQYDEATSYIFSWKAIMLTRLTINPFDANHLCFLTKGIMQRERRPFPLSRILWRVGR